MIRAFILSLLLASLACAGQGYIPSGHVVTFASSGCTGGSDGTIGTSTINNNATQATGNIVIWTPFTPSEDGTVTYCHVRSDYSSNTANVGIWNSSGVIQVDGTATAMGNASAVQLNIELDEEFCL